VVLAFSNLDRDNDKQDNFKIPSDLAPLLGLKDERYYDVKNMAAYLGADPNRRNQWLWNNGAGFTGAQLKSSGFLVILPKVPTMAASANPSDPAWNQRPFEAQFLKLHDVTQPPAPAAPAGPNLIGYAIGNSVTFSWSPANDPDGGVSGYYLQVGTTAGGFDLFNSTTGNTSATISGVAYGTVVYARVRQINNAVIQGPYSSSSVAIEMLDPLADRDGDGQRNAAEHTAGTDPFSASSLLRATATSISGNDVTITVATVVGKFYQLETSTTLAAGDWNAVGVPVEATGSSTVFTHPGGAGNPRRFHRVKVVTE